VHVTLNGEPRNLIEGTTIADLIGTLQLNRRRLAVEVNREVVAQETYASRTLAEGDEIEIVQFVGGG
jgi:thiamine biosynthesis protein ThiS